MERLVVMVLLYNRCHKPTHYARQYNVQREMSLKTSKGFVRTFSIVQNSCEALLLWQQDFFQASFTVLPWPLFTWLLLNICMRRLWKTDVSSCHWLQCLSDNLLTVAGEYCQNWWQACVSLYCCIKMYLLFRILLFGASRIPSLQCHQVSSWCRSRALCLGVDWLGFVPPLQGVTV